MSEPKKKFEMLVKQLRIRVIPITKLKENKNIYTLSINLFFDEIWLFLGIHFINRINWCT